MAEVEVRQRRWWEPENAHEEVEQSFTEVELEGKSYFQLLGKFMGPGIMIAIAYIDPGNYEADMQAGTRFKYRLLWSVLFSHILGYIFQMLTVKQTLATGRTISEELGMEYPRLKVFLWLAGETASIASDLGYVMGTATAFLILFDLHLLWGVTISIFDTFLFMAIQSMGHSKMEIFCAMLGLIVVLCCLSEIAMSGVSWDMLTGLVPFWHGLSDGVDTTPIKEDVNAYVMLVCAMIGASVVPPNFFLHSALTRTRRVAGQGEGDQAARDKQLRTSVKFSAMETSIGIFGAFIINAVITLIAGKLYYNPEHPQEVDSLQEFSTMLQGSLGSASKYIFALSIFAGGQSASVTGTLASQYILEGFMNVRVKVWILRVLTRTASILPAFFITWAYGDRTSDVIDACQIVVNFVVPFTIIPLVKITASPMKMGVHKNSMVSNLVLWFLCFFLSGLNIFAIGQQISDSIDGALTSWVVMSVLLLPYAGIIAFLIWKPVSVPPDPVHGLVKVTGKLLDEQQPHQIA